MENTYNIADTFTYDDVKNYIYPYLRNLFSAAEESKEYSKKLILEQPGLSTNGVFVFFTILVDQIFPVTGITEDVTLDMAYKWNLTTDSLYRQSFENLEKLPLKLSSAYDNLIFQVDTSSQAFPNYECSFFLSNRILNKIKNTLEDDFYIFPASIWKTYIVRKKDAKEICGKESVNVSFLLAFIFSKLGFTKDHFLRHAYLYENEGLKLQELSASKKEPKVVRFPEN